MTPEHTVRLLALVERVHAALPAEPSIYEESTLGNLWLTAHALMDAAAKAELNETVCILPSGRSPGDYAARWIATAASTLKCIVDEALNCNPANWPEHFELPEHFVQHAERSTESYLRWAEEGPKPIEEVYPLDYGRYDRQY